MTRHPVEDSGDVVHLGSRGELRAVDHDYSETELARGFDLGIGRAAARVLGDHDFDLVAAQESEIGLGHEWAAIDDHVGAWQRQGIARRVDEPQQVRVLRLSEEGGEMHPADGQHDAGGRAIECGHGAVYVRDVQPAIARRGRPGRAGQSQERHPSLSAGSRGMAAHLCREGMGRVDDMGDALIAEIRHEPFDPAETANPLRQRLRAGCCDTARERHDAIDPAFGHGARESRRLARAGQDQGVGAHVG